MWNEKDVIMYLHHPGIVKFEGLIDTETNFGIMMEMCCFGSLQDLLYRRVRLTEPEVRFFMVQIIDAVKYLHSKKNIIHRDLKLANIFLQAGMVTKIGDFGLAAQLRDRKERRRYDFFVFIYLDS